MQGILLITCDLIIYAMSNYILTMKKQVTQGYLSIFILFILKIP